MLFGFDLKHHKHIFSQTNNVSWCNYILKKSTYCNKLLDIFWEKTASSSSCFFWELQSAIFGHLSLVNNFKLIMTKLRSIWSNQQECQIGIFWLLACYASEHIRHWMATKLSFSPFVFYCKKMFGYCYVFKFLFKTRSFVIVLWIVQSTLVQDYLLMIRSVLRNFFETIDLFKPCDLFVLKYNHILCISKL